MLKLSFILFPGSSVDSGVDVAFLFFWRVPVRYFTAGSTKKPNT